MPAGDPLGYFDNSVMNRAQGLMSDGFPDMGSFGQNVGSLTQRPGGQQGQAQIPELGMTPFQNTMPSTATPMSQLSGLASDLTPDLMVQFARTPAGQQLLTQILQHFQGELQPAMDQFQGSPAGQITSRVRNRVSQGRQSRRRGGNTTS